jgi:hypothetical protein
MAPPPRAFSQPTRTSALQRCISCGRTGGAETRIAFKNKTPKIFSISGYPHDKQRMAAARIDVISR